MTTEPAADFDGCRRTCRQAGAHTLVYGDCEHAPKPEPTVSLPRVYTDTDGCRSIGFDSYTVPQLARLIEAAVGDPLRAVAAARAIVHRNDEPAAVPVPPPANRAVKAEALLLHFTAEAHRRKWAYDQGLDDDGVPIKSEAFDALHRLGEEMRVELEKLRRLAAEAQPTTKPETEA